MAYEIAYKEKNGEGATWIATNRHRVIEEVTRILEQGTKYVGNKAQTITITRLGK